VTPDASSILNFAQVSPHPIYRGGQPSRDGWLYLKSLGVKTVVRFSFLSEGGPDDYDDFNIISVPMQPQDFWGAFGKPDLADLLKAADAVRDPANWPVYGHCLHGEDRTSCVMGVVRVKLDLWTPDQAWEEMILRHFHPELIDLVRTWEEFTAILS
jgi:tyrosine-protein phosphatase SIW14